MRFTTTVILIIMLASGCASIDNSLFTKDTMSAKEHIKATIETKDKVKIRLDHYRYGHSKVIIVAPGFSNSKNAVLMKELGKSLGDEYDVILMDFRGHGNSSGLFSWTSK